MAGWLDGVRSRYQSAMAVPDPDMTVRLARALMSPSQSSQPQSGMFNRPFAGPTNNGQLPPFQQPGSSLPIENYITPSAPAPQQVMPPVTVAAQAPQAAAAPVVAPPADVPPMPQAQSVRSDVMAALQQLQQAGKLPEQWKGAFSPGYGEPV